MSTVSVQKDVVARSFSSIPATFELPARKEGETSAKYLARASMNSYGNAAKDVANAGLAFVNAFPIAEAEAILSLPAALHSLATGAKADAYHAAAAALENVIKEAGMDGKAPVNQVRAIEDKAIGDGLRTRATGERAGLVDSGVRFAKGAGFVATDALSAIGHTLQGTALLAGAAACFTYNGAKYVVQAVYEGAKEALICVGIIARRVEKDIEKGVKFAVDETEKAVIFVGDEAIKAGKAIEKGVEVVAHDVVEAGKVVVHDVKEGAAAVEEAVSDTAHDVAVGARKVTSAVAKKVRDDASELARDADGVAKDMDSKDNTLRDPLKRGSL